MNHVCIFPTWRCQLRCEYCSIRHSKINRETPERPWEQWRDALLSCLRPGDIVDVAGGEPLLYAGMIELLHGLGRAGLRWAVTTNAKASVVIDRIVRERPQGALCFNVSDHSDNPESVDNVATLRRIGYIVNVHRVDHAAAGTRHRDAQIITYQDWSGGRAVDGVARSCTAGIHHWVADPSGDLWRCVVALEVGEPPVGNLFTGVVNPTSMECTSGCTTCYTEDPASWGIEMRAI